MNDQIDDSLLQATALSDLATVLEDKGLSSGEVAEILLKVIAQVEIEVVEELMNILPDDKKKLLGELAEKNADGVEIAEKLEMNEEVMQQIEAKKFAEIVQEMVPSLNL